MRYCALSRQHSLSSKPCLVVSTLFIRIPINSLSIYSVYRLLPLPVVVNGDKYIYSNLPKVIGINSIEQSLIIWSNELESNECTFSSIVRCRNEPISLPLSKSPCLSQLVDDYQSDTSMCQVSRSTNIEQGILYIDYGLWLFYNVYLTHYCQVHSTLNGLTETISINESMIVRIPCDKTATCSDFHLPAASCKANRVIVTPSFTVNIQNLPHFIMPIKKMTQTLVSSHHVQMDKSVKELMLTFRSKQSTFKEIIHEFGMYILSALCCIFIMLFVYMIKLIKYQILRRMNKFDHQIKDIIDP